MLAQPSNYCYKPRVPRSRPIRLWRPLPCPATLSQKSLQLFSKDPQPPAGLGAPCLPFLPGLRSDRFLDRPLQPANCWWICPLPLTPLCPWETVASAETLRLTRAWALQLKRGQSGCSQLDEPEGGHGEAQRPDPAASYRKVSGFHPKSSGLKESFVVWFTLLKQCPVESGLERSKSGDREMLVVKRQPQNPRQGMVVAGTTVVTAELERESRFQDDLNDRADGIRWQTDTAHEWDGGIEEDRQVSGLIKWCMITPLI